MNAEEASSARAVKGGLSREEAVAWELFSPIQRFLIVAVIGVAAAESKKNRLISQLTKSVEFRDQVLSSMQQKLDSLCEQLYYVKDQQGIIANMSLSGKAESAQSETFGSDKINFVDCGCWLCDQHHNQLSGFAGSCAGKNSSGDEMMPYKMIHAIESEQEERRMSDLSDWASSSGISAAEFQMSGFSIEQDICNLRKECEEKDTTIKELTTLVQSTNVRGSKRISELEDIILRKNFIITRLKKDMLVLEQKVVQLTRQQRSSSSASTSASDSNCWQLPAMVNNVIYDMDSTTSPSSSDSDSPSKNRLVAIKQIVASDRAVATDLPVVPVAKFQDTPLRDSAAKFQDSPPQSPMAKFQDIPLRRGQLASTSRQRSVSPKVSSSLLKPMGRSKKPQSSPLRETPTNQKSRTTSLRQKQSPVRGEFKKARRQPLTASKDAAPPKRWA